MVISDQSDLEAFVRRASSDSVLAVDTEFLRENTYYPKLCLLQLATSAEVAIVDPFAVDDLGVLAELMQNQSIVKLFHAGTQDIEIILREVGVIPTPLFDTQIAAALLGFTQQVGYAPLVSSLCGVSLRKADSFSDWSRRPLSESQLQYAADDVIYLPKMYALMCEELDRKGRMAWLEPDFAELADPKKYNEDPRTRYRRLRRVGSMSGGQLAAAREVAAWREQRARTLNVPRKRVLADEQIVEACKREARTVSELFLVRGVKDRLDTGAARTVSKLIAKGLDLPESEWPRSDKANRSERNVDAEIDLMMSLVRIRAKENDVAVPTLASHDELAKVARGHREDVSVLKGWRRAIVGEELLALMEGRVSLSIVGGSVKVERVQGGGVQVDGDAQDGACAQDGNAQA